MTTAPVELARVTASDRSAAAPGARQAAQWAALRWQRYRLDALILMAVVALSGVVHARGMADYPNWVDDPGTYLSQAWSFQHDGALSPYTYFYDHAPLGWITIGLYSMLTNGFGRHALAMDFGNEAMLMAKLVGCVLLYLVARRLDFGRVWATVAVLLFALNPLALTYSRWTYLDNLVTPWLLLAVLMATGRRKHLGAFAVAGLAFAGAAMTKETALLTAPAFAVLFWQHIDRRTRGKTLAVVATTASLMLLYPAYALLKGELFAGPGHNSLLGTASWQLAHRTPSGSILDPASVTRDLWQGWLTYDSWLIWAGIGAGIIGLGRRRLRGVAVLLACQISVLFTGGYVPFMQIVNLLPWMALLVAGVLAQVLRPSVWLRSGWVRRIGIGAVALVTAAGAATALPHWYRADVSIMGPHTAPPLKQATAWVSDHVPRDQVMVVHDALWTELVAKQGFTPDNVIIVYKLDSDPAVNARLKRIDFLVLPDYYYTTPAAAGQYPTAVAARDRAVPVAHFGTDPTSAVTVYRVSSAWVPRPGG